MIVWGISKMEVKKKILSNLLLPSDLKKKKEKMKKKKKEKKL